MRNIFWNRINLCEKELLICIRMEVVGLVTDGATEFPCITIPLRSAAHRWRDGIQTRRASGTKWRDGGRLLPPTLHMDRRDMDLTDIECTTWRRCGVALVPVCKSRAFGLCGKPARDGMPTIHEGMHVMAIDSCHAPHMLMLIRHLTIWEDALVCMADCSLGHASGGSRYSWGQSSHMAIDCSERLDVTICASAHIEWDGNTNSSAAQVLRRGDQVCGSHASPKGNYPSPTTCAPPVSKAYNMTDNMSDIEVAGPTSAPSPARTANHDE
eukprot:Gb_15816 [translate_table: standard]